MAILHFKGKNAVWGHHLSVPYHILKEDKNKSFDGKNKNENLIIEGDNLAVLKSLFPKYQGKIKCIYIDPPYNTGNEKWVYDDRVNSSITNEWFGKVVGKQGEDFNRHDKWLCMMTPRLKLLKEFLLDDGVLFISINNHEVAELKLLCNEIFGESNFVGKIIWKTSTKNNAKHIADENEYVLCYAKNIEQVPKWRIKPSKKIEVITDQYDKLRRQHNLDFEKIKKELKQWIDVRADKLDIGSLKQYNLVDEKGVFCLGNSNSPSKDGGHFFDIIHPKTGKVCKKSKDGYRWTEETFLKAKEKNEVFWPDDETGIPTIKKYINTAEETLSSFFYEDNRKSTGKFNKLMGGRVFDNPKSVNLIKRIIDFSTNKNDIILDAFAGSGTTAEAVMRLNKEDNGDRKFILIQKPEQIPTKHSAYDLGYQSIPEITRERVVRVIPRLGGGRRVYIPKS